MENETYNSNNRRFQAMQPSPGYNIHVRGATIMQHSIEFDWRTGR